MAGFKGTAIFLVEEKFVGGRELPTTLQRHHRQNSLQKSAETSQTPAYTSYTISDVDSEDDSARACRIRFEATDDPPPGRIWKNRQTNKQRN